MAIPSALLLPLSRKQQAEVKAPFRWWRALFFSITVVLASTGACAGLTSNTLLVVSGNVAEVDGLKEHCFDLEMLQSLQSFSFKTKTPWTEGVTEFTGVRIKDLLAAVGAKSSSFRAIAADDYYYDLKGIDFNKYPIIIAYMKNGKPMSVRELGPLWVMFPFDDHPQLENEKNKAASVWQLEKLIVD